MLKQVGLTVKGCLDSLDESAFNLDDSLSLALALDSDVEVTLSPCHVRELDAQGFTDPCALYRHKLDKGYQLAVGTFLDECL